MEGMTADSYVYSREPERSQQSCMVVVALSESGGTVFERNLSLGIYMHVQSHTLRRLICHT